ncbi:MAG TPA: hypothetical protein DEG17_04445 [Cyanobacteria bacterium UBA11149]|nr:hypothetical protein [Cyanobacteria bacterium UBA11159]HBW88140.1 hypothetical protein [Cyanobacteria bacterium UBA11149]
MNLSPTSGGNPLPPAIQKKMERAFSTNFNNVRIHTGSQAKLIKAQAYTQGNNIHFAPGKYNPDSHEIPDLLNADPSRRHADVGSHGMYMLPCPSCELNSAAMLSGKAYQIPTSDTGETHR